MAYSAPPAPQCVPKRLDVSAQLPGTSLTAARPVLVAVDGGASKTEAVVVAPDGNRYVVAGDFALHEADGTITLDYDLAIPMMLAHYFPAGLLGLGLCALLASFMSGMAGNTTAFNTVWTYDIYQAYIRRGASDAHYLLVGRLATLVAMRLRGKHLPTYTPHVDCGDHVVVINADKVRLTGNKRQNKVAYRHSGYPGGLKQVSYEELLAKRPDHAVELAVKGMLPHNKLGRQLIKKLKVYPGAEHPHAAQQPKPLELETH